MIDGATMLTSTGRYIQPLYPNDWTPDIEEIAHALSNLCRFTGLGRGAGPRTGTLNGLAGLFVRVLGAPLIPATAA